MGYQLCGLVGMELEDTGDIRAGGGERVISVSSSDSGRYIYKNSYSGIVVFSESIPPRCL